MLAGTLLLRFCAAGFAARVPSWSLPSPGHVVTLSLPGAGDGNVHGGVGGPDSGAVVQPGGPRGAGGSWKRNRRTKKTSPHSIFRGQGLRHPNRGIWKRLQVGVQRSGALSKPKRTRLAHVFFFLTLRSRQNDRGLAERQETARSLVSMIVQRGSELVSHSFAW